jgi:hypothetical protein
MRNSTRHKWGVVRHIRRIQKPAATNFHIIPHRLRSSRNTFYYWFLKWDFRVYVSVTKYLVIFEAGHLYTRWPLNAQNWISIYLAFIWPIWVMTRRIWNLSIQKCYKYYTWNKYNTVTFPVHGSVHQRWQ